MTSERSPMGDGTKPSGISATDIIPGGKSCAKISQLMNASRRSVRKGFHHRSAMLAERRIMVKKGSAAKRMRGRCSVEWRTRHDSNVWPPTSEGDALSS
jgi:hypothetical protein